METQEKLSALYEKCKSCSACSLHSSRTNCVFGGGNANSAIMFVGEAPGEQEDLSGMPFVGRAGKLLDRFLFAVDLERTDVYITNILKCRPPKNRDPQPEEAAACLGFLREQLRIIQPKIIVCLGRIAAMRLIKPDYKISIEHGVWTLRGDYLMTAVYHPAALLRDPRRNEEMLADMKSIKSKLDSLTIKE